ncbi:MAG TPA: DinB family protein [Bryobacteraceae bacterium]|nr:DinB family protein [Bryobacteraceae bacterium]
MMNRSFALFAVVVISGAGVLHAQDANPISANMKQSWNNVKGLLQRTAEKMPEENYGFKPTPEMQSFGQRVGHVISFNMRGCSTVQGEVKNLQIPPTASKADILAAMKQADEVCDAVFNSLTDAEAAKMVNAGRGAQRQKLAVLQGLVLEHSQEVYGYMAVYLRLKGIVPPSRPFSEYL